MASTDYPIYDVGRDAVYHLLDSLGGWFGKAAVEEAEYVVVCGQMINGVLYTSEVWLPIDYLFVNIEDAINYIFSDKYLGERLVLGSWKDRVYEIWHITGRTVVEVETYFHASQALECVCRRERSSDVSEAVFFFWNRLFYVVTVRLVALGCGQVA